MSQHFPIAVEMVISASRVETSHKERRHTYAFSDSGRAILSHGGENLAKVLILETCGDSHACHQGLVMGFFT